ncbi:MAG: GNAT family N-acetyltransferase [Muribaculaceae bacterium]|nr:GNAT family N-acetyltransferase [Muribaculaceae bacterium]
MSNHNLTHITVTPDAIGLTDEVKGLYLESFPEEERRPWESICGLIESGAPFFKFVIVRSDAGIAGFYTLWRFPQALYVEHFAVMRSLRGNGFGSEILTEIKTQAGELPVVVEVEPAESSSEAVSRIKFYEKAGFTALYDFQYVQPPYAKGLPEVPMMLMTTSPLPDIELFVIQLHTLVYNK